MLCYGRRVSCPSAAAFWLLTAGRARSSRLALGRARARHVARWPTRRCGSPGAPRCCRRPRSRSRRCGCASSSTRRSTSTSSACRSRSSARLAAVKCAAGRGRARCSCPPLGPRRPAALRRAGRRSSPPRIAAFYPELVWFVVALLGGDAVHGPAVVGDRAARRGRRARARCAPRSPPGAALGARDPHARDRPLLPARRRALARAGGAPGAPRRAAAFLARRRSLVVAAVDRAQLARLRRVRARSRPRARSTSGRATRGCPASRSTRSTGPCTAGSRKYEHARRRGDRGDPRAPAARGSSRSCATRCRSSGRRTASRSCTSSAGPTAPVAGRSRSPPSPSSSLPYLARARPVRRRRRLPARAAALPLLLARVPRLLRAPARRRPRLPALPAAGDAGRSSSSRRTASRAWRARPRPARRPRARGSRPPRPPSCSRCRSAPSLVGWVDAAVAAAVVRRDRRRGGRRGDAPGGAARRSSREALARDPARAAPRASSCACRSGSRRCGRRWTATPRSSASWPATPASGTTLWGQPYGSPLDAWVATPFVAAWGRTIEALRLPVVPARPRPRARSPTPSRGELHPAAALPAAVLVACPPPYFLLLAALPPPFYATTLAAVRPRAPVRGAAGRRLADGAGRRRRAARSSCSGLFSGLALWTHLMSASAVAAAAPLGARCASRGRRRILLLGARAARGGERAASGRARCATREATRIVAGREPRARRWPRTSPRSLPRLHEPLGGVLGTHVPVVADSEDFVLHAPGWAAGAHRSSSTASCSSSPGAPPRAAHPALLLLPRRRPRSPRLPVPAALRARTPSAS